MSLVWTIGDMSGVLSQEVHVKCSIDQANIVLPDQNLQGHAAKLFESWKGMTGRFEN